MHSSDYIFCTHISKCDTYLQPPKVERSLNIYVKRLKNLNKVRLIHAESIWTKPHSKKIKVKLRAQKKAKQQQQEATDTKRKRKKEDM